MAVELGVTPNLLTIWMQLYQAGRITPSWDCVR